MARGKVDLLNAIKKIFLWTYARNTWQWDILCVLILAFIFLTPKSWFEGSEPGSRLSHQSPATSSVLIGPELVENQGITPQLHETVKALTGRADVKIVAVRKVTDASGHTVGYQVDIR